MHHRRVSRAFAGQRVGINLPKVPLKEISVGMTISGPEVVSQSCFLNVDLQVLHNSIMAISNRQRVKLFLGTSVKNTLVVLMEKEKLEPGEKGLAQFRLIKPLGALPQDNFVVCPLNIQTVIGGGTVLEITRKKFRKARALTILPFLIALRKKNLKKIIEYTFKANPDKLIIPEQLSQYSGFPLAEVEAEIRNSIQNGELIIFQKQGFYWKEIYLAQKIKLLETVKNIFIKDPLKNTVNIKEIKDHFSPFMDDMLFRRMLTELSQEGKLIKTVGSFQIWNPSVKLSKEQERLNALLLEYARRLGLVPFRADMFWKFHKKKFNKKEIQRLLDYLHTQKRLIRLSNGRFLTPQAMERIKDGVRKVIMQKGSLNLADSKEILGYGRTVGIPILEYLDEIGLTRREGNERVLQNR
ncbi:MAG: SelB C-terminal domain-containing protein [Deltaproteobacteria bacterium]|nr:SelB C-terminal domain-containing protein [Deltaproteobacteria bacterium]